jgi:GNAT superfamily N-acetyltransferase
VTAVRRVGADAAPTVLEIVRAAFATRPPLHPPADALGETEQSIAAALAHGGLVASYDDGQDVGALVLDPDGDTLWLRRVGVLPEVRDHGVATTLVSEAMARAEGYDELAVLAREELPATSRFWREHGFVPVGRHLAVRRAAPPGPRGRTTRRTQRRCGRSVPRSPRACGPATSSCSRGSSVRVRRRSPRGWARVSACAATSPRRRS